MQRLKARVRTLVASVLERGADTSSRVSLDDLGLRREGNLDYEPSGWLQLRRAMKGIEVTATDTFVDLGCGKGRVVRQAMRYPFARVIGVDLSPTLADSARALVVGRRRRAGVVEVVVADAMNWPVPDDVTILYFYNAFRGDPLRAALTHLIESVDRAPRDVLFLYANPAEEHELLEHPRFALVERRGRADWWTSRDPRRVSVFRTIADVPSSAGV